jgi:hypothetical protein
LGRAVVRFGEWVGALFFQGLARRPLFFGDVMAVKKKGQVSTGRDLGAGGERLGHDQVAEMLFEFATQPADAVRQGLLARGFSVRTVEKFLDLMRKREVGAGQLVKGYSQRDYLAMLREKSQLALSHVTDEKLAAAGVKDVAITVGILTEKAQLLDNRPTAIFSFEERAPMADLLKTALKEAARRNMVIDMTDPEKDVRVIKTVETDDASLAYRVDRQLERLPTEDK